MDASAGSPPNDLISQIQAAPHAFELGQLVRLIEAASALSRGEAECEVGTDAPAGDECLRLRAAGGVGFRSGEATDVASPEGPQEPWRVALACFGLTGPSGALPDYYTRLIAERRKLRDPAFAEFLGFLEHRLASLFVRAGEKHRFYLAYERHQRRHREDPFTGALLSLIGLATPQAAARLGLPRHLLLRYVGVLCGRRRPARALARLLTDHLGLSVRVEEFLGQWLELPAESRSKLSSSRHPDPRCRLGRDTILGARVWDRHGKFGLHVGPLGYEDYHRFMPDSTERLDVRVAEIARFFAGLEFDIEIRPLLRAAEVPRTILISGTDRPARLGRNCWLLTRPADRDASAFVATGVAASVSKVDQP